MKRLLWLVLLPLTGCAVETSGVVRLSEGTYMVTRQGSGPWVATEDLKTLGVREANASCAPKKARVLNVKERHSGALGGWPEAEVIFRCD